MLKKIDNEASVWNIVVNN